MALGTAGFIVMIHRRVRGVWVLLGVVASVVVVAAVGYGNQRFRTACEPVVLVAAAHALVATRRGARDPASGSATTASAAA
jgi:hypothetical protein